MGKDNGIISLYNDGLMSTCSVKFTFTFLYIPYTANICTSPYSLASYNMHTYVRARECG